MLNIPDHCQAVVIELMIPQNPNDPDWRLTGEVLLGDLSTRQLFNLEPGLNNLSINLQEPARAGAIKLELHFGPGFHYADNPDQREFRALLCSLHSEA